MENVITNNNEHLSLNTNERHYGLDLLRIICMVMVLFRHVSHYAYQAGIIADGSPDFYIRLITNGFSNFLVNCFILISAFFLVGQKFKLSRIFKLQLIVSFWLIISAIILFSINPPQGFTWEYLIPFFPVTLNAIWFYTCYVAMCLVSPLLNLAIRHMNKNIHLLTCILLSVLAILINNILGFTNNFSFGNGHSFPWFIVLYFIGAYLKLYINSKNIKMWFLIVIYLLSCGLLIGDWFLLNYLKGIPGFFAEYVNPDHPFDYNSIFTLVSSISIFLIFYKIKVRNKTCQKAIKFMAPHMFAIYILDRDNIRNLQCDFAFQKIVSKIPSPITQVMIVIIMLFILRVLLDVCRSFLFKLFESRKWYNNFIKKLDSFPYRVIDRLNFKEKTI